jgi:hypothetical protein
MKQSNFIIELQYQYLNYITATGIPVLYKILKKIHNTGKKIYTSDRQVQDIQINCHGTISRTTWFMNKHVLFLCTSFETERKYLVFNLLNQTQMNNI